MVDYSNVSTRAMLADLTISLWQAQRFNRAVSDEVADSKQAARDAGRYNVHLFGPRRASKAVAPEFAAVHDAASALYDFHVAQTLPWGGRGERLLATANFVAYTDGMRARGAHFRIAADRFVDAYPRLRVEAKPRLGALYDEADFPPADEVRRRFGYEVEFLPVPSGGDLRVDLPAAAVAEIEQQVAERVEARAREAMGDAWRRLYEAVARIRKAAGETGSGRKSPVYDTLIAHAQETCAILAAINVAQDERLDVLRRRVEEELTGIAVEDLRKDEVLRQDTEQRAADIMASMSAFYAPAVQQEQEVA